MQQRSPSSPLAAQLTANLSFTLTAAQQRVADEIADSAKPLPMLRLVQGDVGSGKTIIAAFAALRAIHNGGQAALMAPTELLAEQHAQNFRQWLEPLGIRCALLTRQMSAKQQREGLAEVADGTAQVVIGTHALPQERVTFHRLVLVIIDEQHRFGVHQRMSLQGKGGHPHQLVMTATPIPRTLTMTLYADMDVRSSMNCLEAVSPSPPTPYPKKIGQNWWNVCIEFCSRDNKHSGYAPL